MSELLKPENNSLEVLRFIVINHNCMLDVVLVLCISLPKSYIITSMKQEWLSDLAFNNFN